jgi:ABC-type lipoprotein release transport system permease subunit
VRRRRRDLAVTAAIGKTRGQIQRAVVVHAVVVATMALVVGVPLGLAGGRLAWDRFAADLGVVSTLQLPLTALAIVIPSVLVGAVLVALVPASVAAHRRAGPALRTE